jgi:allantoinase
MSDSGIAEFPTVDDYTLYEGMKRIAALNSILAVHAENDSITGGLTAAAVGAGKTTARDYLASRPIIAECEAIGRALLFAQETGCRLYIVHVSSARGVDLIKMAQANGVRVIAETCPHYLALTADDLERLGAVAKCAPPLRDSDEVAALWGRVLSGEVQTIGSDHSPASPDLKTGGDFFKIWGGIAGCQSTLSLLLTEGYAARGLSLEGIAALTSANTAAWFGLAHKGRIVPGMDADMALVDLDAAYTLRADDLHYRHKLSPYVGRTLRGVVRHTLVGGTVVYANGGFSDG